MATLGPINAASPLDASDNTRLSFTADITPEVLSRALDNVPADFGTMDTLSWAVEYRQQNMADDTIALNIRIMNGATVLAAADSGGTFATVNGNILTTVDLREPVAGYTAFAYVNTSASKSTWDGASVELQQVITKSKGADGIFVEVDWVEFSGTYTAGGGFQAAWATKVNGLIS